MHSLRPWSIAVVPVAAALSTTAPARAQDDAYEDADPSALVDFHATLDPYGTWIDDPTYGTVWTPSASVVGPDFTPYATGGHWAYGDDYTWVSDYDWGWAPFHYGRWMYLDGRGWAWIAGRQYAPAWVQWRVGEPGVAFVGWAPAPPTFVWRGGAAVEFGAPPPPRFVFCPTGDVFHPRVFERIVRGPQVDVVAVRTRPFEERPWAGGRRFFGPPPPRIGLEPAGVVRVSGYEPGVARAREFARPETAVRYGARPPSPAPLLRPVGRPGVAPGERGPQPERGRSLGHAPERPFERGPDHAPAPPPFERGPERAPAPTPFAHAPEHAPAPPPARGAPPGQHGPPAAHGGAPGHHR